MTAVIMGAATAGAAMTAAITGAPMTAVTATQTIMTDADAATNSPYAQSCPRLPHGHQDLLTKTADAVIKDPVRQRS